MNEKELRKVVKALVKAVEHLAKTATTAAEFEALAAVAHELKELSRI